MRFQSTPPCGGDCLLEPAVQLRQISIHAPLRGRRQVHGEPGRGHRISIHAPLRGRRRTERCRTSGRNYFNPRPLAGATSFPMVSLPPMVISIHAPLRGRLGSEIEESHAEEISIHAPLRGRQINQQVVNGSSRFQSTPPCGGDTALKMIWSSGR